MCPRVGYFLDIDSSYSLFIQSSSVAHPWKQRNPFIQEQKHDNSVSWNEKEMDLPLIDVNPQASNTDPQKTVKTS